MAETTIPYFKATRLTQPQVLEQDGKTMSAMPGAYMVSGADGKFELMDEDAFREKYLRVPGGEDGQVMLFKDAHKWELRNKKAAEELNKVGADNAEGDSALSSDKARAEANKAEALAAMGISPSETDSGTKAPEEAVKTEEAPKSEVSQPAPAEVPADTADTGDAAGKKSNKK